MGVERCELAVGVGLEVGVCLELGLSPQLLLVDVREDVLGVLATLGEAERNQDLLQVGDADVSFILGIQLLKESLDVVDLLLVIVYHVLLSVLHHPVASVGVRLEDVLCRLCVWRRSSLVTAIALGRF